MPCCALPKSQKTTYKEAQFQFLGSKLATLEESVLSKNKDVSEKNLDLVDFILFSLVATTSIRLSEFI